MANCQNKWKKIKFKWSSFSDSTGDRSENKKINCLVLRLTKKKRKKQNKTEENKMKSKQRIAAAYSELRLRIMMKLCVTIERDWLCARVLVCVWMLLGIYVCFPEFNFFLFAQIYFLVVWNLNKQSDGDDERGIFWFVSIFPPVFFFLNIFRVTF